MRTQGIVVVGLAGPSGAGKTVFSSKVRSFLPGTTHIQMDMYNDGTKVVDDNFDDPRLTDYPTLLANIDGRPEVLPSTQNKTLLRWLRPKEVCVGGSYEQPRSLESQSTDCTCEPSHISRNASES